MNKEQWKITPETITHTGKPAFKASWLSGHPDLENISGLYWHDENSGSDEDHILIFDFKWTTAPPPQAEFEQLMNNATSALDSWISERF